MGGWRLQRGHGHGRRAERELPDWILHADHLVHERKTTRAAPRVNVSVAVYVESPVAPVSLNATVNVAPVPAKSCGVAPVTEKCPSPPLMLAAVKLSRAWSASYAWLCTRTSTGVKPPAACVP